MAPEFEFAEDVGRSKTKEDRIASAILPTLPLAFLITPFITSIHAPQLDKKAGDQKFRTLRFAHVASFACNEFCAVLYTCCYTCFAAKRSLHSLLRSLHRRNARHADICCTSFSSGLKPPQSAWLQSPPSSNLRLAPGTSSCWPVATSSCWPEAVS